jgi:hypothetical protein
MDIKNRTIACAFILVVAVLLSGCIGQKTQTVPQSEPPAVFVDYQRTGGAGGLDAHLVIFDNGAGVVSSRSASTEIVLNTTEISRITGLFDYAQFTMLQSNYPSLHGGTDLTRYSVSYHGKTVTVQDTTIPPSFQPVLDELNRIVSVALTQKQDTGLTAAKI